MSAWSRVLFTLAREYATSRVLDRARERALGLYAGVVNAVRRSLFLAILVGCLLQIMTLSLIGAFVTATLLWGGDDKLLILFVGFALLFGLPALGLTYLMSERTWARASGAERAREN